MLRMAGMSPAQIPRPQSQRVTLYEQRFGKFDSGKNAYWSLRKARPVTLAEGAAFDREMRAGRLAPPAPTFAAVALAPAPVVVAGLDIKKLILPAVIVVGVLMASKRR